MKCNSNNVCIINIENIWTLYLKWYFINVFCVRINIQFCLLNFTGSPIKSEDMPCRFNHDLSDLMRQKYRDTCGYYSFSSNSITNYCASSSLDLSLPSAHGIYQSCRTGSWLFRLTIYRILEWCNSENKITEKRRRFVLIELLFLNNGWNVYLKKTT